MRAAQGMMEGREPLEPHMPASFQVHTARIVVSPNLALDQVLEQLSQHIMRTLPSTITM